MLLSRIDVPEENVSPLSLAIVCQDLARIPEFELLPLELREHLHLLPENVIPRSSPHVEFGIAKILK
jgi:hypothetical protein